MRVPRVLHQRRRIHVLRCCQEHKKNHCVLHQTSFARARFFFFFGALNNVRSSNLFFPRTGFHRSPTFATRARTLSIRKSSMRTPSSISSHVTGVDTPANGVGRTE